MGAAAGAGRGYPDRAGVAAERDARLDRCMRALHVLVTTLVSGCLAACSASNAEDFTPGATPEPDAEVVQDAQAPVADAMISVDAASGGDSEVCTDSVDVVFVLDVSSSMGFVLDKLTSEIGKVVTAANELSPESHFGLIAFVDNHALDASGVLEGGKVHTEASTLQKAFQHYKSVYTDHNRNPGDGPSGPDTQNPVCEENSLDAVYAAAKDFPWRATATRVVIVVTDDTFLERPDNYGDRDGDGDWDLTNFPKEGDYPAAWTLTETIEALKASRVRVFSFTRLKPPAMPALYCGTPRRLPWEAMPWGWSQPYNGTPPIPQATDGENFDVEKVKAGSLSLTDTINKVVVESYCRPPIY